jgi:hypothetical protein
MAEILPKENIVSKTEKVYNQIWLTNISITSPIDILQSIEEAPISITVTVHPFNNQTGEIAERELQRHFSFDNIRGLINENDEDTLFAFESITRFIANKLPDLWEKKD